MASGDEDTEARNFFKCWKTVIEMLVDRGYVIEENDQNRAYKDFKESFLSYGKERQHFQIFAEHKDNSAHTIFVFFPDEPKIGVDDIKQIGGVIQERNITRGVVVVKRDITAFARKALERVNQKLTIELFTENELMINITRHSLVPRHIVMTENEKKQLLAKYALKESQLPRMQKLDPVARYFGLARGRVVKIVRPSETAGRYVTYRLVV